MNDRLLVRFIERKCTPEEVQKVYKWIYASEKNRKHYIHMQTLWSAVELEKASRSSFPEDKEIQQILSVIHKEKATKRRHYFLYAAASVAVILFFSVSLFTQERYENEIDYQQILAEQTLNANDIRITLDNGETVSISDSTATINYTNDGRLVINDDTFHIEPSQNPVMNNLHVPYGKRSKIYLPDGTLVHLNSGSNLVYPSFFAENKREVYLEGEGFFEVQKEENRKFFVQTKYKTIAVLGTRFNVCTDEEDDSFTTVLVDGKIALKGETERFILQPSDCYKYKADTGQESIEQVDVSYYTSWVDGILKFEREPLRNILKKIEKLYNVQITLNNSSYSGKPVSGRLELNDIPEKSIDHLLETIIPDYHQLKKQTLINIYSIN